MAEKVDFVAPETQVLEIARKMRDADIGSTPVVKNDRLIGSHRPVARRLAVHSPLRAVAGRS
jgi:CBS domain-containing protein